MNGDRYLLDTNIVIAALNQRLILPSGSYYVSVITEIELLSFAAITKNDENQIKQFLSDISVIELIPEIKQQTIRLRRLSKVKLPDAIICATAIIKSATLVTNDLRLHSIDECETISLNELLG